MTSWFFAAMKAEKIQTTEPGQKKPLISIITVVLNGEIYLEQTIQSVLQQGSSLIEYIILDGGSTDGTLDIIRSYEDRIDFWQSEPDQGIFDAMNKGVRRAAGQFIGILNADDWYEPFVLTTVMDKIESLPGTSDQIVFFCNYYQSDEELNPKVKTRKYSTLNYWLGMTISHQAMFINRAVYDRIGLYSLNYSLAADYEYFLRMVKNNVEFIKIDVHGVNVRRGGESIINIRKSLREASKINRETFGLLSKEYLLFFLNNRIPALLVYLRLFLYNSIGRKKTAALRKIWKRLKSETEDVTIHS
ncbi:glycosyltransferase family 2 protein [candidate division CSSED10-310 bacterium]|uniref:Glycosyltransferase family 2 protein n=1 Tax=candidate division CSSED10-310 bacterium TaxID=2855610 RepID=A0ABV6YS33_UNCC1